MCLGDLRTGSSRKNPNSAAGWREAEEWAERLSHQLRRSCRHAFIVATKTKDQRATHASRALCEKATALAISALAPSERPVPSVLLPAHIKTAKTKFGSNRTTGSVRPNLGPRLPSVARVRSVT